MKSIFLFIFCAIFGTAHAQTPNPIAGVEYLVNSTSQAAWNAGNPVINAGGFANYAGLVGVQIGLQNQAQFDALQAGLTTLQTDQKRGAAAGLAAASVPVPSLARGEQFLGFGVGNWRGQNDGAITWARALDFPTAQMKFTATTGGGFSLGAGVKF